MDALTTLEQWLNGIKIDHVAHLRAAAYYKRANRLLGIPATILAIIIGTSIYGVLSSSNNPQILLFVGAVSILAAVLSGLQTFLNYPELAQKHQTAGAKFGRLRRRVEEILSIKREPDQLESVLTEVRLAWDQLIEESPDVPQRFHDQALSIVKPELSKVRKEGR
jgi:hypothetical protein